MRMTTRWMKQVGDVHMVPAKGPYADTVTVCLFCYLHETSTTHTIFKTLSIRKRNRQLLVRDRTEHGNQNCRLVWVAACGDRTGIPLRLKLSSWIIQKYDISETFVASPHSCITPARTAEHSPHRRFHTTAVNFRQLCSLVFCYVIKGLFRRA